MPQPVIYQHPELDGSSFFWPKGDVAVLCLHGFTATTVDVRPIAQFFSENGLSTAGPLLPGHGTTPEDANQTNWMDWVNSAETMYQKLKNDHQLVFVLGESVGGLLALHLAAKYQDIPGILLFAPALIIPKIWQAALASPFIKTSPKRYLKNNIEDDFLPWQGYNVVPVKAAASLAKFQRVVRKELIKINVPTIIFQGKKDTTIDPMSSVIIYESISSAKKELVWLPQAHHVILLDKPLRDVEAMSLDFIHKILEGIE